MKMKYHNENIDFYNSWMDRITRKLARDMCDTIDKEIIEIIRREARHV